MSLQQLLEQLGASWLQLVIVVISGVVVYVVVIALSRLAGVRLAEVQAVVMETTGDIRVLKAGEALDVELLQGVRGAERLR